MSQDRQTKVLLVGEVGDGALSLDSLSPELSGYRFHIEKTSQLKEAASRLQVSTFDALVFDLPSSDLSALENISSLSSLYPHIAIVVVGELQPEDFELRLDGIDVQEYLVKGKFDNYQLSSAVHIAIEKKIHGAEAINIAHTDALTGLATRAMFYDKLEQSISKAERTKSKTALLMIELGGFSELNKTQGSSVGDKVLIEVSDRLKKQFNQSRYAPLISRLGNDSFAVVLGDILSNEQAVFVADQVIRILSRRIKFEGSPEGIALKIRASIGLAFYPLCSGIKDLLYSAEIALFRAKRSGGNRYVIYTKNLNNEAIWRYSLETELEQAFKERQFRIEYQPQVDLRTGTLAGFEALIRWNHPKRNSVNPQDFIEHLETSKVGWDLTEWMIDSACKSLKTWQRLAGSHLKVDVNVSAFQLSDPNLVLRVKSVLEKNDVGAEFLELELTERQPLSESEYVCHENIKNLRKLGVSFALDDYGTGFNSDNCLRQFPENTFSILKIDRSYVQEITTNSTTLNCIKRDIDFAHSLSMEVIVEGVESQEQLDLLEGLDADYIQGYFVSKAVEETLLADEIRKHSFDLKNVYERKRTESVPEQ